MASRFLDILDKAKADTLYFGSVGLCNSTTEAMEGVMLFYLTVIAAIVLAVGLLWPLFRVPDSDGFDYWKWLR